MHRLLSPLLLYLALWTSLAALGLGSPVSRQTAERAVEPDDITHLNPYPSEDQWYTGPSGWESTTPGTVLRIRPHAYKGRRAFKNYVDVFQVLYRTTDSLDRPLYAATTVFIPESHEPCLNGRSTDSRNCSHALLTYLIPYDTSCFDASLSYGLQNGEPYGEIAIALARGWFVAVPDFEGPHAAYGK